jgi:serine/threonine protein kinase
VLGSGGMGTVWEAYDRRLGRTVALKVLRDDLPPGAAARLEREARAAARIGDARVVTVLDLDRTRDGTPYLVLECHEGATLADELRAGALPTDRLDHLVDDLLGALAAAHECGVLHRDVKPANILASPHGFRVTDFGLASLDDDQTTETDLMGTLVYVAPERLEGARGSTRSDVFSAAVVLYEAASGVQPFRADDPSESVARLRRGEAAPLPDHLPVALRATIHRALSPDPEDRPEHARAMLDAIRGEVDLVGDPTIALDATAILPPAGPDDPTEDVVSRARLDPQVAAPTRSRPEPVPDTPSRSAPATPPGPSFAERFSDGVEEAVAAARRRPEAVIGALAAAILLVLFLVVASSDSRPAEPQPVDASTELPQSIDGVLDRIEELGR